MYSSSRQFQTRNYKIQYGLLHQFTTKLRRLLGECTETYDLSTVLTDNSCFDRFRYTFLKGVVGGEVVCTYFFRGILIHVNAVQIFPAKLKVGQYTFVRLSFCLNFFYGLFCGRKSCQNLKRKSCNLPKQHQTNWKPLFNVITNFLVSTNLKMLK